MKIGFVIAMFLAGTCLPASEATAQPRSCRIINLMPAFWRVVATTSATTPSEQVRQFHARLADKNRDLYSATGFGFLTRDELDAAIPLAISEAHSHPEPMQAMTRSIIAQLSAMVRRFQHTFPDFQCDFPIYLAPSLGKLDGAGRIIHHKVALIIGVDQASQEYSAAKLPIFLSHELFHRYHQQVAGFSDDEGDRAPIWLALWAEGLATYVSMRLTPGATLQEALILPNDLIEQARPRLRQLVPEIRMHLEDRDPVIFAEFFKYHRQAAVVPSRVGYYIGALIAQVLNNERSLFELAHTSHADVEKLERQTLDSLQ
jgi:hypothetical protein